MAQTGINVQTTQIVARAKLPDDLEFDEFVDIVNSIHELLAAAVAMARAGVEFDKGANVSLHLVRSQYGSDFLIVVAIVGTSAGAIGSVAAAFHVTTKALKVLAEAGEINERRRALREERLARRAERNSAIAEADHARFTLSINSRESERPFRSWRLRRLAKRQAAHRRLAVLNAQDELSKNESIVVSDGLREEVVSALPGGSRSRQRIEPLVTLAEYGVTISIEEH